MDHGRWSEVLRTRCEITIDGRRRLSPANRHVTAHAASVGQLKNEGSNLCMSIYGTHTSGDPAYQAAYNNSNNQT